jgi:hypothetical protein
MQSSGTHLPISFLTLSLAVVGWHPLRDPIRRITALRNVLEQSPGVSAFLL